MSNGVIVDVDDNNCNVDRVMTEIEEKEDYLWGKKFEVQNKCRAVHVGEPIVLSDVQK